MKFSVAYGTRPEVIKLAPIVMELTNRGHAVSLLSTGQQKDLLGHVECLLPGPDKQMHLHKFGMAWQVSEILVDKRTAAEGCDCVIVQGDTTTAFGVALSAFYSRVPIAHVEAGLRSLNKNRPWPEECHRIMIDTMSDFLYCPTDRALHLAPTGRGRKVVVTGNTAIDMLRIYSETHQIEKGTNNTVLVTVHRREVAGRQMAAIFSAVNKTANMYPELKFVWPIHPNPAVQKHRRLLDARNIEVCLPMTYGQMVEAMAKCRIIMTDSGGLQEEGPYFGKRVIVLRNETERHEGVKAGCSILAGVTEKGIVEAFKAALGAGPYEGPCPYGDGHAAERIVNHLMEVLA